MKRERSRSWGLHPTVGVGAIDNEATEGGYRFVGRSGVLGLVFGGDSKLGVLSSGKKRELEAARPPAIHLGHWRFISLAIVSHPLSAAFCLGQQTWLAAGVGQGRSERSASGVHRSVSGDPCTRVTRASSTMRRQTERYK